MHALHNKHELIGCGLENIGNSCFFNATIQALFHTPALADLLKKELEVSNRRKCNCFVCAIVSLFEKTQCRQLPYNPSHAYEKLKKTDLRFAFLLNGFQQNAHEFLMVLMEKIEGKHPGFSFLNEFNADIVTEIECSICKKVYISSGTVGNFALEISGKKSIQNALDSYFNCDVLCDYKCEVCGKKVRAKKQSLLASLPRCICIQLKRFTKSGKKCRDIIEITPAFSLSKYFTEVQTRECNYKLVAVINHLGNTPESGHYNTIARIGNEYYRYDDKDVRIVTASEVTDKNTYVLFYQTAEESIDKALDEDMISIIDVDEDLISIVDVDEDLISIVDVDEDLITIVDVDEDFISIVELDEDLISIVNEDDLTQEQDELCEFDDFEQSIPTEIVDEGEIEDSTMDLSKICNENRKTDFGDNDNNYDHQNLNENENKLSGRRIVDIVHLFKQMQGLTHNICKSCNNGEMVFTKEVKRGLRSTFNFRCTFCGIIQRINSCPQNINSANTNEAAVLGIVSIGLGCYHLQEFLAHLDVYCMSNPTFHKLEKKIQADWWKLAKKFESEALEEEIRLAKESNEVDSAGNAKIGVEFDGSWGKRSYSKNFSSLSGCAAIIGLKTNKILYSDVKNKYCHICKIAQSKTTPPNKHECNKNYDGPSSGMESTIIIEGFKFCAEKGARFHKYIGDGDSSTYKLLRDLRLYQNPELAIEKFECVNHLYRNYNKKFDLILGNTKFRLKGRKLLNSTIGRNICVGVRMAAQHWKESDIDPLDKYANLERDIMNAPLHCLGVHDHCDKYFCTKTTEPTARDIIAILKETGLYYEILDLGQRYFANNVKSLIAGLCTNKSEGFNSLIAKTLGGKRVCNSLDGSYKMRTNISEIQFNTKGHSGSTFHDLIFQNNMQSCLKLENTRKRKVEKNAIAMKTKPKRRRFDGENTKTKVARKLYGTGREDVDLEPSKFELAKSTLLERLREDQTNRNDVQIETRLQRHSLKWMQLRKTMVTSSYFGRILNARSRKTYKTIVNNIIYQNEQYSNTAEIRHQRTYEMDALKMFCDVYGHDSIQKCGIFIDAEFCFLGASPFRLYGEDGIIIVKCPKAAFNKSFDIAIKKKLIPFWIGPPNNMRVNFKSHWYFELQGQLRITGKRIAYLVVYLGESVFRIHEVERNNDFWKTKMQNELVFFFNEAMLKEIVDSRDERGMDIRQYNAETKTFV